MGSSLFASNDSNEKTLWNYASLGEDDGGYLTLNYADGTVLKYHNFEPSVQEGKISLKCGDISPVVDPEVLKTLDTASIEKIEFLRQKDLYLSYKRFFKNLQKNDNENFFKTGENSILEKVLKNIDQLNDVQKTEVKNLETKFGKLKEFSEKCYEILNGMLDLDQELTSNTAISEILTTYEKIKNQLSDQIFKYCDVINDKSSSESTSSTPTTKN